jgi:hypothetical protein
MIDASYRVLTPSKYIKSHMARVHGYTQCRCADIPGAGRISKHEGVPRISQMVMLRSSAYRAGNLVAGRAAAFREDIRRARVASSVPRPAEEECPGGYGQSRTGSLIIEFPDRATRL